MPGIINLTPTPDRDYKLNRDTRESLRLNTQHYILTERQGWLVHPSIDACLSTIPNPQIVEVATGTGIWATQAALKYPQADVLGLDISAAQYPPAWTRPANLEFDVLDLLEDVPAHLVGKFDMLHCRLLLAAGPAVDKAIFIDRFARLLKPGGWLQWDEISWPLIDLVLPPGDGEMKVLDASEYPVCQAMKRWMKMDLKNGWFHEFEEEMERDGMFEEARNWVVPVKPHLLKTETDLEVQVLTDLVGLLIKRMGCKDEETLKFLYGAVARLEADRDAGVMVSYKWNVGIARRCL